MSSANAKRAVAKTPPLYSGHVLLIEPDPGLAKEYQASLAEESHVVYTAHDLTGALDILADESKSGTIGHLTHCSAKKASKIITTREVDPRQVGVLRHKGVEVIQV